MKLTLEGLMELADEYASEIRSAAISECHYDRSGSRRTEVEAAETYAAVRDYAARLIEQSAQELRGECNTLAGILRDAQAVIETIEPENDDEAERLFDLRVAMAHAVDPYKREGTLL